LSVLTKTEGPMIKVNDIDRNKLDWLFEQPIDVQFSVLNHHLSICQLIINQLMYDEVEQKAGERYRNRPQGERTHSRHGHNPGSIKVNNCRVRVAVPRLYRHDNGRTSSPDVYQQMRRAEGADEQQLLKGVLYGLSMRDYGEVIDAFEEGFGLSKTSVSREFYKETEEKLKAFEERTFEEHEFVAVFIDGKVLAEEQIVIALGVTRYGEKIPLGFVQAATENAQAVKPMLEDLVERGLRSDSGLLFVLDGSKGLKKAVREVFGDEAVIQRCIWHKQENILSYLPQKHQQAVKEQYQAAIKQPSYEEAKNALMELEKKLEGVNRAAARSLREAREDLLTLHWLDVHQELDHSFSTTNPIENVNGHLEKYLKKVKRWRTSDQRYRWVGAALMEIRWRMRRVRYYQALPDLRNKLESTVEMRRTEKQKATS
jgi:putative transposase